MTAAPRRFRMPRGSDGSPISLLGVVALGALLATIVWAGLLLRPLLARRPVPATAAASRPATDPESPSFDQSLKQYTQAVDGRSLFFIPPAPSKDQRAGPKATTYSGPALIAMINDTAWFEGGERVSIDHPDGKSVKLLELRPPWGAKVEWEGGEFEVDLFHRTPLSSLRDSLARPTPPAAAPSAVVPYPGEPATPGRGPGSRPGPLANPTKSPGPPPGGPPEEAESDDAESPKPDPAAPAPATPTPAKPGQAPPSAPPPSPPAPSPRHA